MSISENSDYRIVKHDEVGDYLISTVWLGENYNPAKGFPLIFETMVFRINKDDENDYEPIDMIRNSTEEDALKAHEKRVMRYKNDP